MSGFRVIPKELKEQILNRIKNEGVSVAQAAKDHGVSTKTIYTWLSKASSKNISFLEYARLKRENKLLLELVGKLTLEKNQRSHFKKN